MEKSKNRLVRKKRDTPKTSTVKFILTWLILLIIALFFVQQRMDYTRTERRVRNLIIEKRQILSSILPLKLEERYLTRYSRIEKAARDRYGLQKPRESQVTPIEMNDPTSR